MAKSIDTAGDASMSDEKRVSHLNSIYYSEIATQGNDLDTPLDIQIMNLGAFAFVGERHNMSHHGSEKVESENMNALVQSLATEPLSDREKEVLTAMATGMQIGYGEQQSTQKFGDILAKMHERIGQRLQPPEEFGDDFLEGLLEAKL